MSSPSSTKAVSPTWSASPLVWAAIAWAAGLLLGRLLAPDPGLLGGAVAVGLIATWWGAARRRQSFTTTGCALMIVGVAAFYWQVRVEQPVSVVTPSPQERHLAVVEGVITNDPHRRTQSSGLLGHFDYRPPRTSFMLQVDRVQDEQSWTATRFGVIVDLPQFDGRLQRGDRVRCIGWLVGLDQAKNPGEKDFAAIMQQRGVIGRLLLRNRGNCQILASARDSGPLAWRHRLVEAAGWALRDGLPANEADVAPRELLELLLLGDRRGELAELDESFRRAGLAHVLAISGLHLAILVFGLWWVAQVATGRPRAASWVALIGLLVYLLIVPPRVPILRAGVMTGLGGWALMRGRRVSAPSVMALAALLLLLWRPADLFSAGFQLSFLVVAALIGFTGKVADWLSPRPLIDPARVPGGFGDTAITAGARRPTRFLLEYVAVSIVAWLTAMPLIAYHFRLVSPAAVIMAVLTLPAVALILWGGYLKILLTMIWPPLGEWLGTPLWHLARWTADAVTWAADLPGVAIDLPQPSLAWVAGALAVSLGLLTGSFAQRLPALVACLLIVLTWLWAPTWLRHVGQEPAALRLNMFAVRDGSCYLLRSGGKTMMFDCGSSSHLDITSAAIGPALRDLGISRIDTLVLSHPDTDHFSGCLELVDRFDVGQVALTQAFLDEAASRKHGATAFVIQQLRRRNVPLKLVARGWAFELGEAQVQALWPPTGRRFKEHNDSSIVLAVEAAGRRVLLCGDIQEQAMTDLLADSRGELRADVTELPHHGSFVDTAPAWMAAVGPSAVLQSSGYPRLRHDKWQPHLLGITRHVTARHGMVELTIAPNGTIEARRYIQGPVEAASSASVK